MEHLTISRAITSASSACLTVAFLAAIGCASPGPPRPPSLHLPQPVSDFTAARFGDTVELRFTVPHLSTDKLPLYSAKRPGQVLRGSLCRELDHHDCVAISGLAPVLTSSDHTVVTLREPVPASLTTGTPRLLGYRVEFYNDEGRSAGKSEAAFVATGAVPPVVTGLRATGTRGGILLQWDPVPQNAGEVLLRRIELAPKRKPKQEPLSKPANSRSRTSGSGNIPVSRNEAESVWLGANSASDRTLDDTVSANEPYRYVALRRRVVTVGAQTFDLRSEPSAPIDFTLRPVYSPGMPSGLTATGFQPTDSPAAHYAVDLIWQPVDDVHITLPLAAPFAGYNLYREQLNSDGKVMGTRIALNPAPLQLPAFHDITAEPATRYRYSVTSVDAAGNESNAATFTLEPYQQ